MVLVLGLVLFLFLLFLALNFSLLNESWLADRQKHMRNRGIFDFVHNIIYKL